MNPSRFHRFVLKNIPLAGYGVNFPCYFMHIRLLPYRVQPDAHGFSHGLKTCHWHVFLTAFRIPPLR